MKTLLSILLITMLLSVSSCRKCDKDATSKVGFYCLQSSSPGNPEETYQLFIDDAYRGDVHISGSELSCGSGQLLDITMDGRKHQVDLKNREGKYLSAQYLVIQKNKLRNGSTCSDGKKVEGTNGSSVSSTPDGCNIYAFIVD